MKRLKHKKVFEKSFLNGLRAFVGLFLRISLAASDATRFTFLSHYKPCSFSEYKIA